MGWEDGGACGYGEEGVSKAHDMELLLSSSAAMASQNLSAEKDGLCLYYHSFL